jgi:phage tail sheath protein FI
MTYNVGPNLIEGQAVSPVAGVTTAISGIIGNFEKGPVDVATLVGSMAQFTKIFGTKPATGSTAWYSVKGFFAKIGTGSLYIIRVAGATAAKATKIFQDRQGTPANTLQVDAKNEGVWGNDLTADIDDYNILSTTPASNIAAAATNATLTSIGGLEVGSDIKFDNGTQQEYRRLIQIDASNKKVYWTTGLTNAYPAATSTVKSMEFSLKIYNKGLLVETHDGLSMNDLVSFYCEKKVISDYVAVTDMKSTDTSYLDLPAVSSSAQALTGGLDGLTDVVKDDYVGVQANKTGKYGFDSVSNLFRFCCPNPILTDVDPVAAYKALVQDLLDYANSRKTVEFYADIPYGTSVANAITFAGGYEGWGLNFFWPWGKAIENSLAVWVPPSSLAMGVAVEKDFRRGVHKNVGNETVPYIIDLEYHVSEPEHYILNEAGINVIRAFAGEGIRTYGGRTRSAVTAKRFLHYAEQWMYIGRSLELATRDIVFEPNIPPTWATTIRRVIAFFLNEQRKNAITNFVIQMDSFNNPGDQVALGIAELRIEYVPAGTIEKLVIALTPSPMGLSIAA